MPKICWDQRYLDINDRAFCTEKISSKQMGVYRAIINVQVQRYFLSSIVNCTCIQILDF